MKLLIAAIGIAGVMLVSLAACGDASAAGPTRRFAGKIWVQDARVGKAWSVSATTHRVATVGVGQDPFAIAITPDGRLVFLACLHGVVAISTRTGRVVKRIAISGGPAQMTVTPDGRTVYVIDGAGTGVVPINTRTLTAGRAITVANRRDSPEDLAVTPDSRILYAVDSNTVVPVTVRTGHVREPIRTGRTFPSMVFTPDSRTGYVLGDAGTVVPISVRQARARRPIRIGSSGASPSALAITPDGNELYVADRGHGTVVPVSTATDKAGKPIKVGYEPSSIAITPDGKTAYVLTARTIVPIHVATNRVGKPIRIKNFSPTAIVISPDGRTAWVTGMGPSRGIVYYNAPGYVVPINVATNRPGQLIRVGKNSLCLVVKPWQNGRAQGPTSCNQ